MNITKTWGYLAAILCLTTLVYLNHFENTFQFDDSHTIVNNIYIRDLKNIPDFFTNASLMSTVPANAQYRPLTTTLIAVEYWLAGGLKPFAFHLVVFSLYLIQLITMYLFYAKIFTTADDKTRTLSPSILSLVGVALYAVHPVSAETVNYLIQQADLTSTLSVLLSFVIYLARPSARGIGLYLIPVILGTLSKPPGFMAAPLFTAYFFITGFSAQTRWTLKSFLSTAGLALRRSLPVWIVCVIMGIILAKCTPPTFTPGGASPLHYILSQPFVILDYTRTLFWPTGLSADTDWKIVSSAFDSTVAMGVVFILALLSVMIWGIKRPERLSVSFGIAWYLIALLPTSIVPLAEVKNDHRMFFPFVGLIMAVVGTVNLLWGAQLKTASSKIIFLCKAGILVILAIFSILTYERNNVWHTAKSLWYDVTQKSPTNGRGLMNYGLVLLSAGDYQGARAIFEKALEFNPNYFTLFINLGIVYGQLGDTVRAETSFLRAIQLAPQSAEPKLFFARYLLRQRNEVARAKELFDQVPRNAELTADMRPLGLEIYSRAGDMVHLKELIDNTLSVVPNDQQALLYRELLAAAEGNAIDLDLTVESLSAATADDFVNLSLKAYNRKNMEMVISFAESALELTPNYAVAYSNKAAALIALERWTEAKEAALKAVALAPELTIAKNNLSFINAKLAEIAKAAESAQPVPQNAIAVPSTTPNPTIRKKR